MCGARSILEISAPSSQFCCESIITLKTKVLKHKKFQSRINTNFTQSLPKKIREGNTLISFMRPAQP